MKWIGLTGGIASGKSSVTKILRSMGYFVVDADAIVHDLYRPGTKVYSQILSAFGPEILNPDQSLDRKKISERVFVNPAQLQQLEQIIHPAVRDEVQKQRDQLQSQGQRIAFYDVPLLFEKNLEGDFDAVVVVATDEETQIRRLQNRNRLSKTESEQRLKSQIPMSDKIKRTEFVISNKGSLRELEEETAHCLNKLLSNMRIPH